MFVPVLVGLWLMLVALAKLQNLVLFVRVLAVNYQSFLALLSSCNLYKTVDGFFNGN
jgi:hypothetical protein